MFIEQKVEIVADSLKNFTKIILSLRNGGKEFKAESDDNDYTITADHFTLTAKLHLFKVREIYDITTEDEINN